MRREAVYFNHTFGKKTTSYEGDQNILEDMEGRYSQWQDLQSQEMFIMAKALLKI